MKFTVIATLSLLSIAGMANGFCTGVPDLTYVRSPNACYLYYSCINGIAYPQSCSEGLYFSTELQRCVNPAESDCDIEDIPELPEAPAPEPSPLCSGVRNYGYIAEPSSCEWYYQCIDEIAYMLSCPKSFVFSYEKQRCGNRFEFVCRLDKDN